MSKTYDAGHFSNWEHARMPALVEKDNRLIRHCRASKYKNGPVIGMRVPSINRGGTNKYSSDQQIKSVLISGFNLVVRPRCTHNGSPPRVPTPAPPTATTT